MAQTIAMQRGSQAVTANNTRYTLFTQSGGSATRVILNALSIWSGSSSGGYFNILLQVNNSGTSVYMNVAVKMSSSGINPLAMSFLPDTVGQINGRLTSTSTTVSGQSIWVPGGNNWPSATDNYVVGAGSYANQNQSNSTFEHCPRNFWIGPGDSVIFQAATTSNISCTLGWNFTTITES